MSPTRQTAICGSQCLTMGAGDGELIPSSPALPALLGGDMFGGFLEFPHGTRRDAELRPMGVSVSQYLGEVVCLCLSRSLFTYTHIHTHRYTPKQDTCTHCILHLELT